MPVDDMEKLVSLCRRRGFIFQSSEIYGGINGFWDYGPLGVELKRNVKDAWWQDMVRNPPIGPDGREISMVGVDCALIMNPKVWEASGHVGGFQDPMQTCRQCKKLFRADLVGAMIDESTWAISLKEAYQSAKGGNAESIIREVKRWSASKGKKLAPNHPMMRDTETFFASNSPEDLLNSLESFANKKTGPISGPGQVTVIHQVCPNCGGDLTEPRQFNLMFKTHAGAVESDENVAYLRPETAQGIFVNFKNVLDSTRLKLPFGIAQVGKAFRNEINPRNYTFRSREFEQMEIEFFCKPDESMKWYEFWSKVRQDWYSKLSIKSEKLRARKQSKDELAHYSIGTTDIEYLFPFSDEPQELEGVAHRGSYDLEQHMNASKKDLRYFDEEGWNALLTEQLKPYEADKAKREEEKKKLEKSDRPKFNFLPHVIEPSAGADRFTLAVLCEAYTEDKLPNDKGQLEERLVMKFHPRLAPIKAAVFPLVKKDGMPEMAEKLYHELKQDYNVVYDDGGAIGRRYRRQDEVGTPFCITIDGETLQNQSVTIRERDSAQQRRVQISEVASEIKKAMRS